jgi:DNA-binding NtrC family response regulator
MAALEELEDIRVVILDNRMPGVSGIELLPEIKRVKPNVQVIMLTTLNSWDTALRVLNLGAFEYVVKPVDFLLLTTAVRNCLKQFGEETE